MCQFQLEVRNISTLRSPSMANPSQVSQQRLYVAQISIAKCITKQKKYNTKNTPQAIWTHFKLQWHKLAELTASLCSNLLSMQINRAVPMTSKRWNPFGMQDCCRRPICPLERSVIYVSCCRRCQLLSLWMRQWRSARIKRAIHHSSRVWARHFTQSEEKGPRWFMANIRSPDSSDLKNPLTDYSIDQWFFNLYRAKGTFLSLKKKFY